MISSSFASDCAYAINHSAILNKRDPCAPFCQGFFSSGKILCYSDLNIRSLRINHVYSIAYKRALAQNHT